jgi:uncharacterized membrane protein
MDELIAVAFDDPERAEAVRRDMLNLANEDLAAFEEAVVLMVDEDGKPRFHHSKHFTVPVALGGGFVGMLAGLVILNPVLALVGGVAGTALGGVLGALKEVGLEEDFMEDLARNLQPGSSVLFVVLRRGDPDQVAAKLAPYRGRILRTTLSHRDEARLKQALEQVAASGP